MIKLEDLKPGMRVEGIEPGQTVTLRDVERYPDPDAVNVIYRRLDGTLGERLLYRENEAELQICQGEQTWRFDADGSMLRLASEAYRISLAHLFDPQLAVHTSDIEPLPHQITAVYDELLPLERVRFLLADDPGAGKTIMAGLLIRELMARGDLHRCLICVPGKLCEQWRDELSAKFQLDYEIVNREMTKSGNPFEKLDRVIVSVDRAKRKDYLAQLRQSRWDLIVCDEAHQMSASYFGKKVEKTQRYRLGELLGDSTYHFLLMTATPHNGKDEDFQLFLKLLDEKQFKEDSVPRVDVAGSMRRMVKEDLRKFDGKPLFPERKAYTVDYSLTFEESNLYEDVTAYIRKQFDRAAKLERRESINVGFALTILQRRLASSPEAIYQSLKRRRERLEQELEDLDMFLAAKSSTADEDVSEETLEDMFEPEREAKEMEIIGTSSTSRNHEELEAEVDLLLWLEEKAYVLCCSGKDRKWEELCKLFEVPEMKTATGRQRKLIIFTEYRDTLRYLLEKLKTVRPAREIVAIDGSMPLEKRREVELRFRNDPDVLILVATDAAGEGINLQCAHLMVNYDLPWNPNRLEQRFGRIHRIGQSEVCHLWSLVAGETREGMVYKRLLEKLQTQRNALNGQVFDVLGNSFHEVSLQKLLVDAIRYGDDPNVKARLQKAIDNSAEKERVRELLKKQALVSDRIDVSKIMQLREDMERASAERLQPFYVKAFFLQAFQHFQGKQRELHRESGRFVIEHVPATLRTFAKAKGMALVQDEYKRICFEKEVIRLSDGLEADFVRPGHPLLDVTISMMLAHSKDTLKRGAILVDENNLSCEIRVLFYLEHTVQDAVSSRESNQSAISREVHFVEIDRAGNVRDAGAAPYLDYRPAVSNDRAKVQAILDQDWLKGQQLERRATEYAIKYLVPVHRDKVVAHRIKLIDKTEAAVNELQNEQKTREKRLMQQQEELQEWGEQLEKQREQLEHYDWLDQLEEQERFEHLNSLGINRIIEIAEDMERREQSKHRRVQMRFWQELRELRQWQKECDQLEEQKQYLRKQAALLEERHVRLKERRENLEGERQIKALQPVVVGAALIVPASLISDDNDVELDTNRSKEIREIAMRAVMNTEMELGTGPIDVSGYNRGYDIECRDSQGKLRFALVKGRSIKTNTVTLTYNETITALNCANQHILALVEVDGAKATEVRYVKRYPYREPTPSEYCVNLKLSELVQYFQEPS